MWERFSASTFWDTVDEFEPVTHLGGADDPRRGRSTRRDAPTGRHSLRYVICGAAPLSVELLEAFQDRFGIRILEGYGLTETTCISSINPFYGDRKAGLDRPARPRPGDEDRRRRRRAASPPASCGEIVIKGPNVMPGYLKNAEANDGDDPRRLAAHRRRRLRRRGRLLLHRRPLQGHDHPRRREHLPARDRGGPLRARRESSSARSSASRTRSAARRCSPSSRRKPGAELDPEELKAFAAERLAKYKVPARVRGPRRAAQDADRQDQQGPAARGTLALISRPGPTYGVTRPHPAAFRAPRSRWRPSHRPSPSRTAARKRSPRRARVRALLSRPGFHGDRVSWVPLRVRASGSTRPRGRRCQSRCHGLERRPMSSRDLRTRKAPTCGAFRCAEEDSNLHPVIPDQALNLARLPIPPSAR